MVRWDKRVRQWAHDNAWTLIFVSFMFFLTWSYLVFDKLTR